MQDQEGGVILNKGLKHVLGFLILIVISMVLLVVEYRHNQKHISYTATPRRWATIALSPITQVSEQTALKIRTLYHRLNSSDDLWKENKKLTQEIQELRTALQLSREQNEQMQRVITLTSDTVVATHIRDVIPAEVVSYRVSPFRCVMVINRGDDAGITVNSTVAHGENLVGSVISTTRTSSMVRLITDPRSVVSGLVSNTRQLCLVKSRGPKEPLRLMMDRTTSRPETDDIILSSGINTSIYPKGLVIGKISTIERNPRGEVTADILPAVDFNRLEEVMIIPPSHRALPGPAIQ